jgi:cytoskeletal protein CcmA (bactofilin family)
LRAKRKHDETITLIAPDTEVTGELRFRNQLFVNGRVNGNVSADPAESAVVVIGDKGTVVGDISAAHVIVAGCVEGNVHAYTKVELAPKSRIKGNVYYKLMEMQLGAQVEGQLLHEDHGPALGTAGARMGTAELSAA